MSPILGNSSPPSPKKRRCCLNHSPLETKEILNLQLIFLVAHLTSSHLTGKTRATSDWEGEICPRSTAHLPTTSLFGCPAPSLYSAKWPLPGMSHCATQLTFIPTAVLWNPAEDFWVRSFFMVVAFLCQRRFLSRFLQRIRVIILSIFLDSSKNQEHLDHCLH